MHYRAKGFEIRSENAAKPATQFSKYLVEYLLSLGPHRRALDLGCGKLRYSEVLARTSKTLTLVDSREQIDREQMLRGGRRTVRSYAANHWPHAVVLTPDQIARSRPRHDFALCANVLSAIPSRAARIRLLNLLRASLAFGGTCLFVSQYRNTYFGQIMAGGRAHRHLDGWILDSARGASYYGILPKDVLCRILRGHRFHIKEAWTHGESAYVLAER